MKPSRRITKAAEEAGRGVKQICPRCEETIVLDPNTAALPRIIMQIQNYGCSECRLKDEPEGGTMPKAATKKEKQAPLIEDAKPKRGRQKSRQQDLPGMEDRRIAAIHDAAEKYVEVRDERMRLTTEEIKARTFLIEVMKKHSRTTYIYDGLEVTFETTEKVKVRTPKDEDGDLE